MFKRAAQELRAARDLMNHGGKHWIKGAEKQAINPKTHKPGDAPPWQDRYATTSPEASEYAYCSIGALGEVNAADVAKIELAKAISPDEIKQIEDDIIEEFKYEYDRSVEQWKIDREEGFATLKDKPAPFNVKDPYIQDVINDSILERAEEIIIDFNDNDGTTWADVRNAFTKAARRLSQRKG